MKKERRKDVGEVISRMTILAMLAALGFVLMAFAQIPYPFAPWLKIEVSEIVTLIAYALYGLPGGLFVAFVKTALNLAVHGPVAMGVGDLIALFTSCMFVLGLFLTSHAFKWFKKGLLFRVFAYLFITVLVTIALTLSNAIVFTPTYLAYFSPNPRFTTCFEPGMIQGVFEFLTKQEDVVANGWMYIGAICVVYVPFNLMKAAACCLVYEVVFNRLIFVFMRKSEFFQKYFVGDIFMKKVEGPIEEKESEEPITEDNK